MRIVQLGPYPPPHGGIQSHIVALRSYLRSQGLACDVINLTSTRRPDSDGVFYPATAFSVARRLLTGRYDVIHLHVGGDLTPRAQVVGLGAGRFEPTSGRF